MTVFVLSAAIHTATFSDLGLLWFTALVVLGQIAQKDTDVSNYTSWSPDDL